MSRARALIGICILLPAFASAVGAADDGGKSLDGSQEMTAKEYRQGLETLRGYLEKRGEKSTTAELFIGDMERALPGSALSRVPVTRDVFAAFLRYEAAWARKTRDGKNVNVTRLQHEEEVARARRLKALFRKEASAHSPRFYGAFQASVKDVRKAFGGAGKDYAGNSAIFFGDQIDDSYTHVDAGDVALENGDALGAIAEADRALDENPENADAYVLRAGAEYEREDLASAIRDARSALRLDPDNQQARAILSLSGTDAARTALKKAVAGSAGLANDGRPALPELGPDGSDQAASSPASAGGAPSIQALAHSERVQLRSGPPSLTPSVGALLSRDMTSRAVREAGVDARSSIEQLDQALALNPRNATARSWRATIANRIGDYSAALASAEQTLTGDPDDAVAHFNKAYALAGAGDKAGMIEALEQAARVDASYQPLVEQARALTGPEDMKAFFNGSAARHEPAIPPSRRRRYPLPLVVFGALGGLLILAGAAQFLRKGR